MADNFNSLTDSSGSDLGGRNVKIDLIHGSENSKMFLFSDIALLSNKSVQKILMEAGQADAVAAFKNGDYKNVLDKFTQNMSRNSAKSFLEKIENAKNISPEESLAARNNIINITLELDSKGVISIKKDFSGDKKD